MKYLYRRYTSDEWCMVYVEFYVNFVLALAKFPNFSTTIFGVTIVSLLKLHKRTSRKEGKKDLHSRMVSSFHSPVAKAFDESTKANKQSITKI